MPSASIPTSCFTDGSKSTVEWMNRLGRGIDNRDSILSESTRFDIEQVNELAIQIDDWLADDERLSALQADTSLSNREAEVLRLKEL